MPYKALRPCSQQGCPALVKVGEYYCPAHAPAHKSDYKRQNPEINKLYGTMRWKKYRKWYLAEYPLCINYDTCHNAATVVDHIKDHHGDNDLTWNPDNLQPMCNDCHEEKHKTGRWRRVRV